MPGVKLRLPALLLLLVSALPLRAVIVYTWSGSAGGLLGLNQSGNWRPGNTPRVPPSSSTGTALVFSNAPSANILVTPSLEVQSLSFTGSYAAYTFQGAETSFGIGDGGITVAAGTNVVTFDNVGLNLLTSQTWNVAGNLVISGYNAIYSYVPVTLTKTGAGTLTFGAGEGGGNYSFGGGGVDVTAGTLLLAASSFVEGPDAIYGPVGSGTLTLRNGARLASTRDVQLDNPIVVESGARFGNAADPQNLLLLGQMTLQAPTTTLVLDTNTVTQFGGSIIQPGQTEVSPGTTASLTFTGLGLAILSGTNTYTGGTTANGSGVVFGTPSSVPVTGAIAAINNGYIGSASPETLTAVLSKISNPSGFTGSLGLETSSTHDGIQTYTGDIDLSGFSSTNFKGLGSVTSAIVTGNISTVGTAGTGDYKFGGGIGTLYVDSSLPASSSAGLTVSAPLALQNDDRFTLVLRGSNTFSGPISVGGSNVIFDALGALPSTRISPPVMLGAYGYAGYTETTQMSFDTFLSRIDTGNSTSTGVIGIDSHLVSEPRTLVADINLSGFTNIYLGSATKSIIASNATITPPSSGTLSFAGVNDGYLKVNVPLPATGPTGVSSVVVGLASTSPYAVYAGAVELAGASTYTGNTTLSSGYLILGSSSIQDGPIIYGPIGKGTLVVPVLSNQPALGSANNNAILHNPISLLGAGLVIGGADTPGGFGDHSITFSGVISGPGSLDFRGVDTTYTLNGNNTFSGGISVLDFTTVMANSNTAVGTGMVNLGNGTLLQFNSSTPVIGGSGAGGISGSGSISLTNNSTLQINQQREATFSGQIDGTNITVTKTGSATLHLSGSSSYTGTTYLNQGTVVAEGGSPFGDSTVRLNGGTLVATGSLNNQLVFDAPTRLGGTGVFTQAQTIGTNATLAPGQSPGTMTFSNGLTFTSGGVFEVEVQSATSSPGVGWDSLNVAGGLNFSTPTTAFRLDLISLSTSGIAGNVSDFTTVSTYSWQLALVSGGITGFSGANVTINTAGFTNPLNGGAFSLSVTNFGDGISGLMLNFTPVPEPSTWALLATGLGVVVHGVRRRKRR
jgi:autotransporter-associated beta strand protein